MDADTEPEGGARRSDRWAAGPSQPGLNWWAILGVVSVLAGYGVAALVAAIVKGDAEVGDGAGLVLVGLTPALGALGLTLGLVGRRREGVHWLAWFAIVLGGVLILVSLAAVIAVAIAFRSFS